VNLETCPLVEVPLPLVNGGVGVAQVRVTDREFPLMTADPPMEAIADKLDFPVSLFAPRQEGAVQLILGESHIVWCTYGEVVFVKDWLYTRKEVT
jgi:hypothetical protein